MQAHLFVDLGAEAQLDEDAGDVLVLVVQALEERLVEAPHPPVVPQADGQGLHVLLVPVLPHAANQGLGSLI